MTYTKTAILLCTVVTTVGASPGRAETCPTGRSASQGFVVERNERQKTEVFPAADGVVRTVMRYDGQTLLETTQFQGLFQLDRIDQGRRAVFRPKSDLAPLFPLKAGQKISVEFDLESGNQQSTKAGVQLSVRNADVLSIGPCKYSVLKIDRSESRGDGDPRFIDTDYYSPDLKLVLAKEYRENDGGTHIVKFDRIYPIKR